MSDATSISTFPNTHAASSAMHTFAIVTCALSLVGVLTGAMVTSSGGTSFVEPHHMTAGLAGIAALGLGIWMAAKQIGRMGLWIAALALAAVGLGFAPQTTAVTVSHALAAQMLFALTMGSILLTGSAWSKPPERVADHGWPSLRSLGTLTPILVVIQIALGAAFRHKAMGVLPHLFGAMVLVLAILCVCIFVMQQFPTHPALRPSANQLMAIAFTQIFLGIAAFTVRTMTIKAAGVVIGVTAAHACVGAMTLGAALMLAMQIRRNVFKPAPEE